MAKNKKKYICSNCGEEYAKWFGQCPDCSEWGTFEEMSMVSPKPGFKSGGTAMAAQVKNIGDIEKVVTKRFSSGFEELDRVLGKSIGGKDEGFVAGQVVLLSGEPGIGKSTILLQLVFNNVSQDLSSVYVSGEESAGQIGGRINRLVVSRSSKLQEKIKSGIKLINETSIDSVISALQGEEGLRFVIIDSIQTIYSDESTSLPGSIAQVKLCVNKLVDFAKSNNVVLVIVGHINKEGRIAGPKMLEHMVDTVLLLEGDEVSGVRTLRSLKNRFGPTNEVGMFRMEQSGMKDLSDPSELFDDSRGDGSIGVCKSIIVEGLRPMVVEVQALTTNTPFSLPKRVAEGVSVSQLQRIAAILTKYSKINLSEKDIYVKISGNLKVTDPAVDLAIAAAIISSAKNLKVSSKLVAVGELNLTGNIANVVRSSDRKREAKRLGYSKFVGRGGCASINRLASCLVG